MALLLAVPHSVLADANKSDELPKNMQVAKVRWAGVFGGGADPLTQYCLMGQGFFLAPTSKDIDRQIRSWLAKHPNAKLIPISSLQPELRGQAQTRLVYVWVQDGTANLNLHLVRTGCCPAGTMQSSDKKLHIPKEKYESFLKQAQSNERAAKKGALGIWGTEEYLRGKHLGIAEKLQKEGKYREAIEELNKVLEHGGSPWLRLAECQDKAGDYEAALKSYDKAIGKGDWWPPYIDKACCISRNKGSQAATRWLEKLIAAAPKDHKFYHLLGEFHMTEGRNDEAVQAFERSVATACAAHEFHFDREHCLVLDQETLKKENNDFVSLWPDLEYLADLCLEQKDHVKAWKYATMGVSIGQQLKRCLGYYSRREVEAGDVRCRLVRAHIYMKDRKWEEAGREIQKAKVLAEQSGCAPHEAFYRPGVQPRQLGMHGL